MDRLKGKKILVGKEDGGSRLLIYVDGKTGSIANDVPNSVSRLRTSENRGHCQLSVDNEGHMVVKNLVPANTTFVNGREITQKSVEAKSQLQLGKDKYSVGVGAIISGAQKLMGPPAVSIGHLKDVWENFNEEKLRIANRKNRLAAMASLPMLISMGSGALFVKSEDNKLLFGLIGALSFGLMLYIFWCRFNDHSVIDLENLQEEFEKDYVCPHCHKYLPQKYSLLKADGMCPKCHCKFVE